MSRRNSQRALFSDSQMSPSASEENLFGKAKRNIHSTPKHGNDTIEMESLDFSAIIDGNLTFTSGKQQDGFRKAAIQTMRNRSVVNFGFVALGDTSCMKYRFINPSDGTLRFKVSLENESDHFQILNNNIVVEPKEEGVISLKFSASDKVGHYQNRLFLQRMNGLNEKFKIKVMACSGRSDVRVSASHLEDRSMMYSTSGKIIFRPNFHPPPPSMVNPFCSMTLSNNGHRSAFICVQAIAHDNTIDGHVKVEPALYILNKSEEKKFKISVQRNNVIDCSTKLRVIWGDELERMRFRIWCERSAEKLTIYDEDFARPFPGEFKMENKIDVFDHTHEEFKDSLKLFEINVVDTRLAALLNLRL